MVLGLLVLTLSFFGVSAFLLKGSVSTGGYSAASAIVAAIRCAMLFGNSYVVLEDRCVLQLFSIALAPIALASRSIDGRKREAISSQMMVLFLCACTFRLLFPAGWRERQHATHHVQARSLINRLELEVLLRIVTPMIFAAGWALSAKLRGQQVTRPQIAVVFCLLLVLDRASPRSAWLHVIYVLLAAAALILQPPCHGNSGMMYWVLLGWLMQICSDNAGARLLAAAHGSLLAVLLSSRVMASAPCACVSVVVYLLAHSSFFAGGHQATFSTIDWSAGLVGLSEFDVRWSGFLVWCRTFSPWILAEVGVRLHSSWPGDRIERVRGQMLALAIAGAGCACCSAYAHRDHLMLYAIFCPKFVFEVAVLWTVVASQTIELIISASWGSLKQFWPMLVIHESPR
jgi:hypothetical protein